MAVQNFLKTNPGNVVGIHCKAGKGRTGVVICCYLLFIDFCKTAKESLVYYGQIRTQDGKGVTIPSQIRYVYYFEHYLRLKKKGMVTPVSKGLFKPMVKKIFKIRMVTIPIIEKGGFYPNFQIICNKHIFYDYLRDEKQPLEHLRSVSYHDFHIFPDSESQELLVYDDVKIQFFNGDKKLFHCWFHTFFIDQTENFFVGKDMIDKACSDKKCHKFDKNFSIKVFMTHIGEDYKMADEERKREAKPKINEHTNPNQLQLDESDARKALTDKNVSKVAVPKKKVSQLHRQLLDIAKNTNISQQNNLFL